MELCNIRSSKVEILDLERLPQAAVFEPGYPTLKSKPQDAQPHKENKMVDSATALEPRYDPGRATAVDGL